MASKWPVIVHQSLISSGIVNALAKKPLKVRGTILPDTVIFPLSGVAFMILPAEDGLVSSSGDMHSDLVKSIDRFIHVHRLCYLLLKAQLHGKMEQELLHSLQQRFLSTSLHVLPVHNSSDIVLAMFSIAKLLCKQASDTLSQRFSSLLSSSELITSSIDSFCKQLDLSEHQIQVTKDRLGSLSKMATASYEELIDCSLDSVAANRIISFFGNRKRSSVYR